MNNIQKDIVIVGAGMVGLSLALALHNKGLEVAIIESKKINSKELDTKRIETRVSAINHISKRLFKELGIWQSIAKNRISPYYKMQVWDRDLTENISITAEDIAEHSLGSIIENDVITYALLSKIKDTNIEIYEDQKITKISRCKNTAKVVIDDKTIETNLVVGADGSCSFIRDYFNFETKVRPYNHNSIVATLELEKPHNQTAYQRFYDKGVLAFLPLECDNKCSIVWSVNRDYCQYLMNLEEIEFEKQLSQDINKVFGKVKLLSKRFSFELFQRHAKSYIQEKVVLVGDAAHSIHPLAGQGVNIGFKDVIALTDVLGQAFEKGRLLGDLSTLDKYQRERKFDNTKMMFLMKAFKEVFASDNEYLKRVRRFGLGFVNKNNMVKKIVVKQAL